MSYSKWKIHMSEEQETMRKRERINYFRYLWIIGDYFPSEECYSYSYLQVLKFTNYSYSNSFRSWLRKSIPICRTNTYLLNTALNRSLSHWGSQLLYTTVLCSVTLYCPVQSNLQFVIFFFTQTKFEGKQFYPQKCIIFGNTKFAT